MNTLKTINIEGIGTIIIEKKSRQKSLRLRINPQKGVIASAPKCVSDKELISFINKNKDWIVKNKTKVENRKTEGLFDEHSVFKSRKHRLLIERINESGGKTEIKNGIIHVQISRDVDIKHEAAQKFIHKSILYALKNEAIEYLPNRVKLLASKHNFKYSGLKFGIAQRSFGSCKSDNTIILSALLMMLPDELIDYVILHELCHTIHKNHGKGFYKLLDECTGGKSYYLNRFLKSKVAGVTPGFVYSNTY